MCITSVMEVLCVMSGRVVIISLCVPVLVALVLGPENDPGSGTRICPENRISVVFIFSLLLVQNFAQHQKSRTGPSLTCKHKCWKSPSHGFDDSVWQHCPTDFVRTPIIYKAACTCWGSPLHNQILQLERVSRKSCIFQLQPCLGICFRCCRRRRDRSWSLRHER